MAKIGASSSCLKQPLDFYHEAQENEAQEKLQRRHREPTVTAKSSEYIPQDIARLDCQFCAFFDSRSSVR